LEAERERQRAPIEPRFLGAWIDSAEEQKLADQLATQFESAPLLVQLAAAPGGTDIVPTQEYVDWLCTLDRTLLSLAPPEVRAPLPPLDPIDPSVIARWALAEPIRELIASAPDRLRLACSRIAKKHVDPTREIIEWFRGIDPPLLVDAPDPLRALATAVFLPPSAPATAASTALAGPSTSTAPAAKKAKKAKEAKEAKECTVNQDSACGTYKFVGFNEEGTHCLHTCTLCGAESETYGILATSRPSDLTKKVKAHWKSMHAQ